MERNLELTMLGTGNAAVTKCYNTCFAIRNVNDYFLVDAGGGNGILVQLERAGIDFTSIHTMFVTHAHTDHILGAIWIVRMIAQAMKKGKYNGIFDLYGNDKVIDSLELFCRQTLPKSVLAYLEKGIYFHKVNDGDRFEAAHMEVQCFDIHSTKEKQYGFRLTLPDGRILVCLGDEPYNDLNRTYVQGADWLLCEAFCLYADKDIFQPYEKHHSTALDAGKLAETLGVRKLLLYHTEDKNLSTRKERYGAEARQGFSGEIYVPDDLEKIQL